MTLLILREEPKSQVCHYSNLYHCIALALIFKFISCYIMGPVEKSPYTSSSEHFALSGIRECMRWRSRANGKVGIGGLSKSQRNLI